LLVALAENFAQTGFIVLRCDLPFRQKRASGPPRGSAVEDQAGLERAVEALREFVPERLYLGGQSYGGRQASIAASKQSDVVSGLLLLSYPLHAPGKPEKLRVEHFPKLSMSALFVHGTKDPFGSIEEMQQARKLIPAETGLVPILEAGHDLGYSRKKTANSDLPAVVLANFTQLFG
jgi:predicted alpha/beta-hydrolase family hydrolase